MDDGCVCISAANGEDYLANVDTSDGAVRLAPCTTHTSLKPVYTRSISMHAIQLTLDAPISSSTRQHLVDPDDMEGVYTDPQMERIFARSLGNVLVGTDTGSL